MACNWLVNCCFSLQNYNCYSICCRQTFSSILKNVETELEYSSAIECGTRASSQTMVHNHIYSLVIYSIIWGEWKKCIAVMCIPPYPTQKSFQRNNTIKNRRKNASSQKKTTDGFRIGISFSICMHSRVFDKYVHIMPFWFKHHTTTTTFTFRQCIYKFQIQHNNASASVVHAMQLLSFAVFK